VTNWKKPNPKHQPLKCSAEWHLWRNPLALAIYGKAGGLTRGGTEGRTFFANQTSLAKFFGAHRNAVSKAMILLRRQAWLIPTLKEDDFEFVHHDTWAALHDAVRCQVVDADPGPEKWIPSSENSLQSQMANCG
jgi:hypothetical protein